MYSRGYGDEGVHPPTGRCLGAEGLPRRRSGHRKQRYSTRTVRAGKREAQRLNEMITEAERGLAVRRNATVGEPLEAWFEMASGDFSPSTVKETRGLAQRGVR